ncbi:MAG: hypothetical protein FVQ81_07675 [Candidatus Glassbacteria bacterium]|nr:hypothetical protein [Candidatus Glassbacteria bacterium]
MKRITGSVVVAVALLLTVNMTTGIDALSAAPRGGSRIGAAQDGPRGGRARQGDRQQQDKRRFERMCEFLDLDESQQSRAADLFEARRREMQESFKQHREAFEALLNPQQLEKLAIREEQRGERRGSTAGPGVRATEQLGLSDSQQDQMKELRKEHHDNLRSIRDRIRNEDLGREQARELLKAEQDRFRGSLSGVLSPEQLEQLDRIHEKMAGRRGQGRHGRRGPGPLGGMLRGIHH